MTKAGEMLALQNRLNAVTQDRDKTTAAWKLEERKAMALSNGIQDAYTTLHDLQEQLGRLSNETATLSLQLAIREMRTRANAIRQSLTTAAIAAGQMR